jgi:lambda family phage portal protein
VNLLKRVWGAIRKRAVFAAARVNRLTADWVLAPTRSADQDIRGGLQTLRARAREMVNNDPYASRFLDLLADNVVGPKGIRLQSRNLKKDGEFDTDRNARIEEAWKEWGHKENASTDGLLSWLDVQRLHLQTVAQDGESLVRIVRGFENPFGFALQLLDPDQLDVEFNRAAPDPSGNVVRMGVEKDPWGRPVNYHIFNGHPSDHLARPRKREVLPATDIIHQFVPRRIGQTRAVTWFAPVLMDARMLRGYREAELVAARTAAAKMGFLRPDPEAVLNPNSPAGSQSTRKMQAEPGSFEELPPGMSVEVWDPQHPNSAFEAFTRSILQSIATGLRTSYASLTGDLSGVNYSSIRQGSLQEHDGWKVLQRWMEEHFHRRIFLEWLRIASLSPKSGLPSEARGWTAHDWMPRGWDWVDPLKDIQAAALSVRLGLNSRSQLAAAHGRDYEEVLQDLQKEAALEEQYGIHPSTDISNLPKGEPDEK